MRIRTATISDIDNILEIQEQLLILHYDARPDMVSDFKIPLYSRQLKNHIEDRNSKIFVAEEDNKIVGHCIAEIRHTKDHPILRDMTRLEIQDLCVDKDYRFKGIGKALFKAVLIYAEERRIKRIEVGFWEFNKNAKEFYVHLGMKMMMSKMELKID
jgi:GNAT superfamily N-acetyltransferase